MSSDHATQPADDVARFLADVAWLARAEPLVSPAYWAAQGLVGATCHGWRIESEGHPTGQSALSRRLGHHFERVHEFLLRQQAGMNVHAMNRPIAGATGTLGELDCLWTNAQQEVIHREVAVKYYLGCRESEATENWVGPAKVDRLDKKLDRFVRHQARLPALALAQNTWPHDLPLPTRSEVLMMGALFRHLDHQAWPPVMNEGAEGGFWCTVSEFVELAGSSRSWVCLHKPWWLSPKHRVGAVQTALEVAAAATEHPVLVGHLDLDFAGRLAGRGFVVSDAWPHHWP